MELCWVTINTRDLHQSLKFYQEVVELSLNRQFTAGPGVEIAFLGEGETKIELICTGRDQDSKIGPDISLGFIVKSIDAKMAQMADKGIQIHSGPFQPNPKMKFFHVIDPDGVKIQFVENMD